MNRRGVKRIDDMIGSENCAAGLPDGTYVRSVPEPFYGYNLSAAWEVLRGRAHAVEWPKPGDLERALKKRI